MGAMHHHGHMHMHHLSRGGTRIVVGSGSVVGAVIMLVVALFMLGMAAVFFVVAQTSRLIYLPFTITAVGVGASGVVMLVIGVVMLSRRANAQKLRAEGVPGQAQIVGLRQTSMYVNNQPVVELQLQVTTAMHAPYVITRRETVPLAMTGLLTSGRPLPVMVDRTRQDNLVILWESALSMPAGIGAPPAAF
jgi:hypothetical protein